MRQITYITKRPRNCPLGVQSSRIPVNMFDSFHLKLRENKRSPRLEGVICRGGDLPGILGVLDPSLPPPSLPLPSLPSPSLPLTSSSLSPTPTLPLPFPSLPLPLPLITGVRGITPGKKFEIADARRRVLAHFGYKIQHFNALGFVLVFRIISRHNIISNIIALCCSKFHQILKYIGLYYVMYPSTLHH
jgi:hypothetical protein